MVQDSPDDSRDTTGQHQVRLEDFGQPGADASERNRSNSLMPRNKKKAAPPGANFSKGGGPDPRKARERDLDGDGTGNYPNKTAAGGKRASSGGSAGPSQKDRAGERPARDLLNLWRREGRCLGCGSEAHRIRDCVLNRGGQHNSGSSTKATTTTTGGNGNPSNMSASAQPRGSSDQRRNKNSSSHPASKFSSTNPKVSGSGSAYGGPGSRPAYGGQGSNRDDPRKGGGGGSANGGSGTMSANGGQGSNRGSGTGSDRGVKRQRDSAPSGATPPPKRTAKFSYASAAAGSMELVIRNEAGEHISKKDLARLKQLAEEKFMAQLDKGEELIQIEGWNHTSLYASVHVGDAASAMAMVCEGKKLKLKLVKKAEFEKSRKNFVIMTGLVTGPAAQRDKKTLDRFIKAEMNLKKVPGDIEVYSLHPTASHNLLLSIKVDEDAEPRLKELDYTLRVGASGPVKFADTRSDKKVDQRTRAQRLELLKQKLEEKREELREHEARIEELNKLETVSEVGSLGVSAMDLDSGNQETAKQDEASKSDDEFRE